ncbi:hypothetical protein [Owenweeksia hongkongensis]|uniref:hypothetical protein n=1 Tax=Owenweeksia hongkongensis TaxID=253245 RepID=UPI003A94313D
MKTKAIMLCMAVMLVACGKKDKDKSLTITVVEYGTNKPIPNVGVKVYDYESFDDRWGGRDVYYDSVVTNSQGRAFLDGKEHEPRMIRLYSHDKNYYDQWPGGANGEFYISKVRNNSNTVKLIPFAWAQVRFIKESKNIRFIEAYVGGMPYPYYIDTQDTLVGPTKVRGNTWSIVNMYMDGNLPPKRDSLNAQGHDTTVHEIIW